MESFLSPKASNGAKNCPTVDSRMEFRCASSESYKIRSSISLGTIRCESNFARCANLLLSVAEGRAGERKTRKETAKAAQDIDGGAPLRR